MACDVVYFWHNTYGSEDEALESATGFHEALRGNPDYVDSNIILSWDGKEVSVTEFSGSKTHVRVRDGYLKIDSGRSERDAG